MTKIIITKAILFSLAVFGFAGASKADFHTYNTFEPRDSYFHRENRVPEYYRPRSMNPLMAMLPEYSMSGPGYICDTRQAPPVYRLPLQWQRNVGYREADWFNNRILDRHYHPMNFGGYDY
jgi:hypothetical protein